MTALSTTPTPTQLEPSPKIRHIGGDSEEKSKRRSAVKAAAALTMTEELALDDRHLEKAVGSKNDGASGQRWTKEVRHYCYTSIKCL